MVRTVHEVLPRVDPLPLLLVLPLTLVINLVRGARFSLALGTRGPGSTRRMFQICALLVFLNFMLPFKTGEVSFPVLAKRSFDTSYATSIGVLVYSRVMDFLDGLALGGLVLLRGVALLCVGPRLFALAGATAAASRRRSCSSPASGHLPTTSRRSSPGTRAPSTLMDASSGLPHRGHLAAARRLPRAHPGDSPGAPRDLRRAHDARDGREAASATACSPARPRPSPSRSPSAAWPGSGPMQASWAYALTIVGWKWEVALANAFLYHATMVAWRCGASPPSSPSSAAGLSPER